MLQKISKEKCFQENWLDKSEIEGLVIFDDKYRNVFIRVLLDDGNLEVPEYGLVYSNHPCNNGCVCGCIYYGNCVPLTL